MSTFNSLILSEYNNLLNEFNILLTFLPIKVSKITTIINSETSSWNTTISNISNTLQNTQPLGNLSTYVQNEISNIQSEGGSDPSLSQLINQYNYPGTINVAPNAYLNVNNVLNLLDLIIPGIELNINNLVTDSNLLQVLELLRQYNRYCDGIDIFNNFYKFQTYETTLVNSGNVVTPQSSNIQNTLAINGLSLDFNVLCENNSNINSNILQECFLNYLNVIELDWNQFESFKNQYYPIFS
jgi:hypothetical protein